jgi:hypothetical protein
MEKTFKVLRKYSGPPTHAMAWVDGVLQDVKNPPNVKRVKYTAVFWNGNKHVTMTFDQDWTEMRRTTSSNVSYYSELVKAFK